MFPGLSAIDVADVDALAAVLEGAMTTDGPSVISIECSADEIPPFATCLNQQATKFIGRPTPHKGERSDVPASA